MESIDARLIKKHIPGKGWGIIASDNIPRGSVVLIERPIFRINEEIFSDIFQIINLVIKSRNDEKKKRFESLYPSKIDMNLFGEIIRMVKKEYHRISGITTERVKQVYNFLEKQDFNRVLLYALKYTCNGFSDGCEPVILIDGAVFNHSCLPNLIFGMDGGMMHYITNTTIKKGEELTINYVNILLNTERRTRELRSRYGFICSCVRCTVKNHSKSKKLDKQAFQIENDRYSEFGYTKQ